MKNIFIVAFLFSGLVRAETVVQCAKESVAVPLIGFTGFGTAANKDNKIAKLISPNQDQDSTFDKSFEIGIYRFVRNEKKWDIYRKDKITGKYEFKNKMPNTFLIDADQSIWVNVRADGMLNIRRVSGDSELQKEVNVIFSKKEITVQDLNRQALFRYVNCDRSVTQTSSSKSALPPAQTGK
jgi:hypothetical protein